MVTTVSNLTIPACWIIFTVYWIANWRRVKRVAERENRSDTRGYRIILLLGLILLFSRLRYSPVTELPRAMAAAVCVLRLLVALWARRTLADNWSGSVALKQGHELIQTGPYRFARHPIYTGILMMCFGTALAGARLHCWLGFLLQCAGLWIKLTKEDSLMLRHFPDAYPAYRARVKAIIPFIV